MHTCTLIIDSCCDLPFDVVNRDGIELVEFPYITGEAERKDDLYQSHTPHEFFQSMRDGDAPTTSQVTPLMYREIFERATKDGNPAVYLCFTSGLSGSFDVATLVRDQMVAERPELELYVVDTLQASIAEGFLVYEAIRQWEGGLCARELAQWAEEARYYIDAEFMLDDLEALKRGGRIPASIAYAGSKLDVKPLLIISVDGKLSLSGVARGRKKGIRQLVDYYDKRAAKVGQSRCVVVGNADCPKDAERLKELLAKVDGGVLFLESNIGPVIGSHVGPGMIALVFWGKDRREDLSVADRIARKVKGSAGSMS